MRIEFVLSEGKLICPDCGAALALNKEHYPAACWVCYECQWMGIVPDEILSVKDSKVEKELFEFFKKDGMKYEDEVREYLFPEASPYV